MFGRKGTTKPAPEFMNINGWLNSPPLSIKDLKGKVVLLDFWTYSCVNCIRTLPHMKNLHAKYSGDRFILIGVHTPEFQFEKSPENVAAAVKRFDIRYPVALDSDNVAWRLYGNQYWPRQTLVDSSGSIRWEHAGEGDYDEMEQQVRRLIAEPGQPLSDNLANTGPQVRQGGVSSDAVSPEIYLGSLRSRGFGNGQVCVPGSCTRYIDPKQHVPDLVYLDGDWTQLPECLLHATNEPGYALLKYHARNANAVLGTVNRKTVRVGVELNGRTIGAANAGHDLEIDARGSFLSVNEHRLYDLVRTPQFENNELKLSATDDSLCVYTYTFG